MEIRSSLKKNYLSIGEVVIIVGLACVPLFITFPYRVNIFLSWEGAYRISKGEIPFRDFGTPLGGMYWVIPAFFFKLFGVQMVTLIKAQVFINILSGLAFRAIFKNIGIQPGIRFLSVVLYCISFSFFNFWPWYNHTVIVYEMISLAFLTRYIFSTRKHPIWLCLTGLFVVFSFLTKQDSGALAFLLCFCLLLYHCFYEKKWMPLLLYSASVAVFAVAFIVPLSRYSFNYWFNYGQPPHTSRFSAFDILDDFFMWSQWIKFYLFIILILAIAYYRNWKEFFTNKRVTLFLLLTSGILAEAAILQVTSYTPPDNNIFYHSFAFAFIFSLLADFLKINYNRLKPLLITLAGLLLWWSGVFWKYVQRIAERILPASEIAINTTENIVNKKTYVINNAVPEIPMTEWIFSGLKSFDGIYMPRQTVEGLKRLLQSDLVKNNKNLHVLNMSELTPLAEEMPFRLETGPHVPLWYHLGVAMFNKQAEMYEQRIENKHYDLILFEYIPTLNNFYPFRVRDALQKHYQKIDSFAAPRRGITQGMIEVYTK